MAAQELIETDVCVIGAGPAGIAFARGLVGSDVRVDVLESGQLGPDAAADDLARGRTVSRYLAPGSIAHGRHRQFGGTANLWIYHSQPLDGRTYARSLPPQPMDFEPSAARDHAWPFGMAELDPWMPAAQSTWNDGPYDYRPESWGAADMPLLDAGGTLRSGVVQHGPSDVFTLRYRDELLGAPNVTVRTGHTVLSLEADRGGDRIARALVARADGSRVEVGAQVFVLAGGGIENVQTLLLSAPTRPGGPGNRHDVVGRYVTDHPEFRLAALEPRDRRVFDALAFYDLRWHGRSLVAGMLSLADDIKRADGLLNSSIALVPQPAGFGSPANRSLATLIGAAHGEWPSPVLRHAATVARSPRDAWRVVAMRQRPYHEFAGGWSRPGPHRDRFAVIEAYAATEQSPSATNRVTLDRTTDALGRARPRLDWAWTAADRANVERSIAHYREAFDVAGLGRFHRWVELDGPGRPWFTGIHHPMGGTRMDADPRMGVVDENAAVHGLENLYVAGSSVFSTGLGYANPTLTILALAIRLSEHVKSRLGVGGTGPTPLPTLPDATPHAA